MRAAHLTKQENKLQHILTPACIETREHIVHTNTASIYCI